MLIDQGFSVRELKRRLQHFDTPIESVKALCLTHLHPDHAKGAGVLARMHGVPVVVHVGAVRKNGTRVLDLGIPTDQLFHTEAEAAFKVGPFTLMCFETSHDCPGSVGWLIRYGDERLMVLTDTGRTTALQRKLAQKADVLFLEANYDEEMLRKGPYPPFLQNRIRGEHGHLSNAEAFTFLTESKFAGEHLYFVHLSDTNNSVHLLETAARTKSPTEYTICEKGQWYGMQRG